MKKITQWSTVEKLIRNDVTAAMTWLPEEDRLRLGAYLKYDEMYWNDPRQYALRVLEGERPVYIPNARVVVDTTAHYLLKGLELTCKDQTTQKALDDFLKREAFFSRFNTAKVSGVARGDFFLHLTADPRKPAGSRISLNPVEPMNVFPIWDEDEPNKMVGCHLASTYYLSPEEDPEQRLRLRRLTYMIVYVDGKKRISRKEVIYRLEGGLFDSNAKVVKTLIPEGLLDPRITSLPIYWFPNKQWQGELFGSSELRGVERLSEVISQGATDVAGSLSLEGLGVYATDGGRPIDDSGADTEWEVAPGRVMEVPQGSYFRRVEGISSITPAKDNIEYLEKKIMEATALSDVALGRVDAQVAQSGIALAIKFLPTLAKIETRDQAGLDILTQMFFDWKTWHEVFEQEQLQGDIVPAIGDKLPMDRVAKLNELNNMLDRKAISVKFYREELAKLGYDFPADIDQQIKQEAEEAIERARATYQATKGSEGDGKSTAGDTLPSSGNGSNNKSRPNESSGTEATQ